MYIVQSFHFLLQKITVAECIETQSKAMTMLNLEQLSYLLKFALQKMKQPGVSQIPRPSQFIYSPRIFIMMGLVFM